MESGSIAETDFRLGRMDVDVNLVRRQFQKDECDCITAGHEQSAISFLQGVAQAAVANPSAVNEHVLHLRVAALVGGIADETPKEDRALPRLPGVNPCAQPGAEKHADAGLN